MLSLRTCLLLIFVGACGPKAPMTTATAGEDGSSGSDTVGASTSTTSTTTTAPTTGAGTFGTSTGAFVGDPDMGGATFIVPPDPCHELGPDGELRCLPIECDPWTQNCPDGEKCSAYSGDGDLSWDSLKCVPLDPDPDHPGDPCTAPGNGVSGIDSCDKGSMCWKFDTETMTGTCVLRCTGGPDDPICPPDHHCLVTNDGVLNLCYRACDPLAQNCPGDEVCMFNPQDTAEFICLPDESGDEGQTFDPCEFVNACDEGLQCAAVTMATECDQDAFGCCLPFCDTTQPPSCPGAMQECLPWFTDEPAPPGLENVGVCGIPQ